MKLFVRFLVVINWPYAVTRASPYGLLILEEYYVLNKR